VASFAQQVAAALGTGDGAQHGSALRAHIGGDGVDSREGAAAVGRDVVHHAHGEIAHGLVGAHGARHEIVGAGLVLALFVVSV
jgi:hypothetical protein